MVVVNNRLIVGVCSVKSAGVVSFGMVEVVLPENVSSVRCREYNFYSSPLVR